MPKLNQADRGTAKIKVNPTRSASWWNTLYNKYQLNSCQVICTVPALELRLAVLHHVDVELVGVPVAVAALGALVLGRVHLVLVVQQTLCLGGS